MMLVLWSLKSSTGSLRVIVVLEEKKKTMEDKLAGCLPVKRNFIANKTKLID